MVKSAVLDDVFGALSDPTRRAIVARLGRGQATVGELAEPFAMSLPAVSKHVSVLERAGLVHRAREGRHHVCRLRPANLTAAASWLDRHRDFWAERLTALADHLARDDAGDADERPEQGEGPASTTTSLPEETP